MQDLRIDQYVDQQRRLCQAALVPKVGAPSHDEGCRLPGQDTGGGGGGLNRSALLRPTVDDVRLVEHRRVVHSKVQLVRKEALAFA